MNFADVFSDDPECYQLYGADKTDSRDNRGIAGSRVMADIPFDNHINAKQQGYATAGQSQISGQVQRTYRKLRNTADGKLHAFDKVIFGGAAEPFRCDKFDDLYFIIRHNPA